VFQTLVNRDTFALLPASYRYQLTGLLPECDRVVDSSKDGEHKVLAPSETAFTNEFFTQAVQVRSNSNCKVAYVVLSD